MNDIYDLSFDKSSNCVSVDINTDLKKQMQKN